MAPGSTTAPSFGVTPARTLSRHERAVSVRRHLIATFDVTCVVAALTVELLLGPLTALCVLTAFLGVVLARRHQRGARVLELLVACWLLVVCAPLMLAAAGWIKLHDGGPVLAPEKRSRPNGSPYVLWSFRVQDLTTGQPTTPGRWLHGHSLHALPAIVNVLRGDIGLIGRLPRIGLVPDLDPAPPTPYVVHVTEVLGGVRTYLDLMLEHSNGSVRYGFVLAQESDCADELRDRGHDVAVVAMPRTMMMLGSVLAAHRLRRTLHAMAPDVVHLHSSQAGLVGRLAWARRGRFVVYTPHAYYYLGKSGVARLVLLTAEIVLARLFPTKVLTTSPSETARAIRDVRVPAPRVATCTNAVAIPSDAGPRELCGGTARVGLIGRVSAQKNLSMYLRVAARLQRDPRVAAECHFVGLGHYEDDLAALHSLMHEAGLSEGSLEVHRWMPRADLLVWLRSCDVIVLTSDYESFGYALAEASACGIPVVGTDIDGIRDVVLDRVSGFIVPRDDDAAMAERVV
ncbi:hypothetical protein BH11ACT8_BH11ACT8_30890 [soil metagenome]